MGTPSQTDFPQVFTDQEPLLKITSRTPFLNWNMHKFPNKRCSTKATLVGSQPLLAPPSPPGGATNTLQPNIQPVHVQQMPHAPHGDTWILH